MEKSSLVIGGTSDRALHCAYDFTAATVCKGGSNAAEPVGSGLPPVVIEPTELVWVKAKEEVEIPADMVGIWIQTQTLSRQGLLLLNTTLIEPGYKGPLTAVFVNFGSQRVPIGPTTSIAKVMFLKLDKDAASLVDPADFRGYDERILKMALNSPSSFLQLEDHIPNVEKHAQEQMSSITKQLDEALKNHVAEGKEQLSSDTNWQITKLLGGFALGMAFVIGTAWLGVSVGLPKLMEGQAALQSLANNAAKEQRVELAKECAENVYSKDLLGLRSEMEALRLKTESLNAQISSLKK